MAQFESLDYEDGESEVEMARHIDINDKIYGKMFFMRWVIMFFIGSPPIQRSAI